MDLDLLPKDALTTAHFICLINQWFSLVSSRHVKTSITACNKDKKFDMLERMITVIENTVFGIGWKPLNIGLIMSIIY